MKTFIEKKIYRSAKVTVVALFFAAVYPLAAGDFKPADYAPADDSVYIETGSYYQVMNNLKSFYTKLRGKQASQEWKMLGMQSKEELGFDLTDFHEFTSNTGIDIHSPVGISIKLGKATMRDLKPGSAPPVNNNDIPDDEQVLFIIPAVDGDRLYRFIKAMPEKDRQNMSPDMKNMAPKVTEIVPGKLMKIDDGSAAFVANAGSHVIVGTTKERVENSVKAIANPVSAQAHYNKLKSSFLKKRPAKEHMVMIAIHPSLFKEMLESATTVPGMSTPGNQSAKIKQYIDELYANLDGMGGFWSMDKVSTAFNFSYVYKPGYVESADGYFSKLLIKNAKMLSLDYFAQNPMLYMMGRMNVSELWTLIKSVDPQVENEINTEFSEFKTESGIDIEQDIINALYGNLTIIVSSIPDERKMKDPGEWPAYLSAGIKQGKEKNIKRVLGIVVAKAKEKKRPGQPGLEANITDFSGGTLYTFVYPMAGPEGRPGANNEPQTGSFYVLVKSGEVIMTTNRSNLITASNKGRNTVLERVLKVDRAKINELTGIVYLNVQDVVDHVRKSRMGLLAAPYIPYVQNIDQLTITSIVEGNTASSELEIKLKH